MNIEIIRNTLYKVVPPTVGSSRVLACRWGGPWACWLDLYGVLGQDAAALGPYPGGLSPYFLGFRDGCKAAWNRFSIPRRPWQAQIRSAGGAGAL